MGDAEGLLPWIMLSASAPVPESAKRLMIRQRTIKTVARIVVDLERKSAVRRTPKTVPTLPPPKDPASPPPLLDCIKMTTMSRKETRSSINSRNVNMAILEFYEYEREKDRENNA